MQQQLLNFQLFSSIKSTAALAQLRELETLVTTQDLIVNIIQTYMQMQVFEKQVALLQQNFDGTDRHISETAFSNSQLVEPEIISARDLFKDTLSIKLDNMFDVDLFSRLMAQIQIQLH